MGESVLAYLFSLPLTFSITVSLVFSQISVVSSVETTPVRRSSVIDVKYSKFPQGDLGPIGNKFPVLIHRSSLGHIVLYLLEACRQRFHSSQIPSGCLPHFCRHVSHGKTPSFVWRNLLLAFHEIVLSLSQSPTAFRASPSLVRKSTVHVEVTGVL